MPAAAGLAAAPGGELRLAAGTVIVSDRRHLDDHLGNSVEALHFTCGSDHGGRGRRRVLPPPANEGNCPRSGDVLRSRRSKYALLAACAAIGAGLLWNSQTLSFSWDEGF